MKNGKLLKQNMMDCYVTLDNLLGQLRLKGAHNLSEIDSLVLGPFKEMLFHEESMTQKHAQLSRRITDPKLQQMLKGMQQGKTQ